MKQTNSIGSGLGLGLGFRVRVRVRVRGNVAGHRRHVSGKESLGTIQEISSGSFQQSVVVSEEGGGTVGGTSC